MTLCSELERLAAMRPLGVLDPTEEARLAPHLDACASCRAVEREAQAVLRAEASLPGTKNVSWESIEARLDEAERAGGSDLLVLLACTYCKGTLLRPQTVYCASCLAPAHEDCFALNKRCGAPGCGQEEFVRPTRALTSSVPRKEAPPTTRSWRSVALPVLALAFGVTGAAAFSLGRARLEPAAPLAKLPAETPRPAAKVAVETPLPARKEPIRDEEQAPTPDSLFALHARIAKESEALMTRLLAVDPALEKEWPDFVPGDERHGLAKLVDRGQIDYEGTKFRGGGAYFSFLTRSHSYDQKPNLELQQMSFGSGFYGGSTGAVIPLDKTDLRSVETRDLPEWIVATVNPHAHLENGHHDRPEARVGRLYAVRWISQGEGDALAVFQVIARDERTVTFAWRLLPASEPPAEELVTEANLGRGLAGPHDTEPPTDRAPVLARPVAVLAVRSGAGGGNPNTVDMLGGKSIYVDSLSTAPIAFNPTVEIHERSHGYVSAGTIPEGKRFVITKVTIRAVAAGDSNGDGEAIVAIGSKVLLSEQETAHPRKIIWTGRAVVRRGQESSVKVECANSSHVEATFEGEFEDDKP